MSNSIFSFGDYEVHTVAEPFDMGKGAFANYQVLNTRTGINELYFATYLQAASACVEISKNEDELAEYISQMVEDGEYEQQTETAH